MSDPICNERGIPQSGCPPFCPHNFGPVGPDGFTRLAGYVAKYVNDSPAALRVKVTEHQWTALEMARKADAAVYQETAQARCEWCGQAGGHENGCRLGLGPDERGAHRTDCNCAPPYADCRHPACDCTECVYDCPGPCGDHEWLDRPESDTRECLICGTEVSG